MAYRNPSGQEERTRASVQVYLVLRQLHFKLTKTKDEELPFRDKEFSTGKGDPIDLGTLLSVCLSLPRFSLPMYSV